MDGTDADAAIATLGESLGRDVVRAVLAGRTFGTAEQPSAGAEAIPGHVIRQLVEGRFGDLAVPRIRIHGVLIAGDVDLSYVHWQGELDLRSCRVEGDVILKHGLFKGDLVLDHAWIARLDLAYVEIDGRLRVRHAQIDRGIYGPGARVSGAFSLRDTQVTAPRDQPNRSAIDLFRAHLADVYLNESVVVGGIYASGIVVERHVRLREARIMSREGMGWETGPDSGAGAVNLVGARIGGSLYLSWRDPERPAWSVAGGILLTDLQCGSLRVQKADLLGSSLLLDHLEYRRLLGVTPAEWLHLLDMTPGVKTQPYVKLADYCAGQGRTDLQRRALIHLQDNITATLPTGSAERARRHVWSWSVRYGYRPELALVWLLLCVGLSVVVIRFGGSFLAPADAGSGRRPDGWLTATVIALDNLLPFAGLGEAKQWHADPHTLGELVWLLSLVLVKFLAWGLAAIGLASVVGIMRRQ